MQESRIKNYIYVERNSQCLLGLKKSADLDFFLEMPEVQTYLIEGPALGKLNPSTKILYSPASGFSAVEEEVIPKELHSLLLRKIEILTLLKTNIELSSKEIKKRFSSESLIATPFAENYFFKYLEFMKREEKTLSMRLEQVFTQYVTRISSLNNLEDLNDYYLHIINNVNVGTYSFISK